MFVNSFDFVNVTNWIDKVKSKLYPNLLKNKIKLCILDKRRR